MLQQTAGYIRIRICSYLWWLRACAQAAAAAAHELYAVSVTTPAGAAVTLHVSGGRSRAALLEAAYERYKASLTAVQGVTAGNSGGPPSQPAGAAAGGGPGVAGGSRGGTSRTASQHVAEQAVKDPASTAELAAVQAQSVLPGMSVLPAPVTDSPPPPAPPSTTNQPQPPQPNAQLTPTNQPPNNQPPNQPLSFSQALARGLPQPPTAPTEPVLTEEEMQAVMAAAEGAAAVTDTDVINPENVALAVAACAVWGGLRRCARVVCVCLCVYGFAHAHRSGDIICYCRKCCNGLA